MLCFGKLFVPHYLMEMEVHVVVFFAAEIVVDFGEREPAGFLAN